mmetsp:Transcript_37656/g.84768  ORF Transcript_37656/g.84768 Transcript_37656/m.84768 type:complete len:1413 (+) Transcript_37656:394-4632(+)
MQSIEDYELQQAREADNHLSDDDNAAAETDTSDDDDGESPLALALDDLESRAVSALNDFKSHPGRATDPKASSVHDELASVLRPVVEVSSHAGPSAARALAAGYPGLLSLDECVDEIYDRVNADLVLPVILESAQSDVVPAKRAASLALFHTLHREWARAGSYLDATTGAPSLAGPYGPGVGPGSGTVSAPPFSAQDASRRNQVRIARRSELLRRWVQASIPNLAPGTFTSTALDSAAASRGVLSASSALKPCLRYMAERIGSADDAGALRLFLPVMRMVEGVLGRLFLEKVRGDGVADGSGADVRAADSLRASCVKFLEIVVLCFSNRALPGAGGGGQLGAARMKREANTANDFCLEDLPPGHPIITRESLEEIGEHCFSTLRGLVMLGGQAAIDESLLKAPTAAADSMGGTNPFASILGIIKPAALAYLAIESAAEKAGADSEDKNAFVLDRKSIQLDFCLSQKSYSLSINAVQMLATKRPVFFKDSAYNLARRTIDPPGGKSGEAEGSLSRAAVTGIRTALRSTCLTLLRNFMSVTSGSWEVLTAALKAADMEAQAERALKASKQQLNLMRGGRAARNRAAIFYEWDTSADDSRAAKRQRETDSALEHARAAKMARGLGSGIQLPASMVEASELVMLNLENLPPKRPPVGSSGQRKRRVDLDFVVDAVVSNGASLAADQNHWYDRNGGEAWSMEEGEAVADGRKRLKFTVNAQVLEVAQKSMSRSELKGAEKVFAEQARLAATNAFSRVLQASSNTRSDAVADFSKKMAARLAWTLKNVDPSKEIDASYTMAIEATENAIKKNEADLSGSLDFAKAYPLVASCLAYDLTPKTTASSQQRDESTSSSSSTAASTSLAMRILNEAYVCSLNEDKDSYEKCLEVFVSTVVNACDSSNSKPGDNEAKRIANSAASSLPHLLGAAPALTATALNLVGSLCDIGEISRKASAKSSKQTIAESAALHAAKTAAEKRATAALLILRDVCFQRDALRGAAIDCAVAIATGRMPGSPSIEDKALKLVMNVIFPKNSDCSDKVVASATKELEYAARYSVEKHDEIAKANEEAKRRKEPVRQSPKFALQPLSEEEKIAMDKVRKPVVLSMALCVRKPELIKAIMETGCREKADVLAKAVKSNMPKLTRAASTKYGAANIAKRVAEMASEKETPLLLSFLDNLAPVTDKTLPSDELIDACFEIQRNRPDSKGDLDASYIVPILSGMKRDALVQKLSDFVKGGDEMFKVSLRRMSERLGRYALIFRDEPDPSEPTLRGMSSCEQMVYLHRLDFQKVGIPQKRYLDAIRLCLEDEEVFNDRVVQATLDYISGKFLEGESLPLAYLRTIILVLSKHESLHSWICHVLLPRLVEGKIYEDKRQWEGWMRCAKMLEGGKDSGVSSLEAIQKLPEDKLAIYRAKYPKK